jgi:signal transduction histidine kinase/CheY-like chemotaxis protein/methyl-accepting chemotaxis protein
MTRKTRPPPEPTVDARLREREVLAALRRLRRGEFAVRLPDGHDEVGGQICEAFNDVAELLQSLGGELSGLRDATEGGEVRRRLAADGLRGGWKRCVDDVNGTFDVLQGRADEATQVLAAVAGGDFTPRIDDRSLRGEFARQARAVNRVLDHLSDLCRELTRVSREVGTEGNLGTRASLRGMRGGWKELADAVNLIASSLTVQVREIARVTAAIARGDLGKTIDIEVHGEMLELKTTINAVVEQLGSLTAEVTRVAQEASEDGRLGGHAEVPGVSGVWRELVDQVNLLAGSLTDQVRDMAEVTTAVARGDLSRKVTVDARGEILVVKNTVNMMVDQLAVFAAEITRIGREVGTEGILGGQVEVRGVAGIWRDIVDNVNFLARNLTAQVRGVARVVTAVARGDLGAKLVMDTRGEISALKDDINHMIRTLAETTRYNQEQDWLKTQLTRLTRMLQGQRDLLSVARGVLSELVTAVGAQVGVFYIVRGAGERSVLRPLASHALAHAHPRDLALGEGLAGQVALSGRRLVLTDLPDDFLAIEAGVGRGKPACVVVSPVLFESEVKAVVELAALRPLTAVQLAFLEQFFESLGIVLTSIEAQERTDELLRRSQELAEELRAQQEELRSMNEELGRKAEQLFEQKSEVERKNQEIELARRELEEKAEQLQLTSKYKSQFLANMSHELRTPLNSLLILSRQLSENARGNLDDKQILYAQTIHQAGSTLLELINEILDLARLEHGKMDIQLAEVAIEDLRDHVERMFRHVAEDRRLAFAIDIDPALPPALITDERRLKQVLRNLLSNAFKFTDRGSVQLTIAPAPVRAAPDEPMIAFAVRDTGIGIPPDQQKIIFEAFQQADGTTSRKYGGTGLGLAISRQIANRLGGDLRVVSRPGAGSTFTLYLPRECPVEPAAPPSEPEPARPPHAAPPRPAAERTEARAHPRPDERTLLIVADDPAVARTLAALAGPRGFFGVVAGDGAHALDLVQKARPDALVLDLDLPDVDGWVLLDRLKHDPRARQIPTYVVGGAAIERRARQAGALGALSRPVDADVFLAALADLQSFLLRPRQLLIVAHDPARRQRLQGLAALGPVVAITTSVDDALAVLARDPYDCVLVDGAAPGCLDLLAALAVRPELRRTPIVVDDGEPAGDPRWARLAEHLPLERVADPDLALVAATLYLHCPADALPPERRAALLRALLRAPTLAGRKVLIVDDDVRVIFTLTAVLEHYDVRVVFAQSGREALDRLAEHGDVELVLLDIMMPDMDGYETTRAIRARPDLPQVPIIALTAKAMKGDRAQCVRAGAADYITKPVDPDQLVSLLRVTLAREP